MEKASRSPGTFQPIFPELTSEEENAKTLAGKKLLSGEFTFFQQVFSPLRLCVDELEENA